MSSWEEKSKLRDDGKRNVTWKERTLTDKNGDEVIEKQYPFPRYVAFLLGNEFCERYCFYGLRCILVLYLTYFIGFDEDSATVIYHSFTVCAYFFPLIGGAIADGWWGKYKTILTLSCVYVVGVVIQAASALPALSSPDATFRSVNAGMTIAGLFIIAMGTGGIKPCVSSFGGDQFESDDKRNTTIFFDLFYWAINLGSVLATLFSPIIRTMSCGWFGTEDSCYFIAFAIPAVLMVMAIAVFVFGQRYYRKVPATGQNIFWEVIKCMWYGAWKKVPENAPEQHWLYGAYGIVDDWIIRDTKYVVRVLVMFLPLPIFWTGFDLRGSRWVLECVRMDGYIFEGVHITSDQTQILNPILILTLIPVFNYVYLWCNKCFAVTRLRKISFGMFLASMSYIICAEVQKKIEVSLTISPSYDNEMALRVINFTPDEIDGSFTSTSNLRGEFQNNPPIASGSESKVSDEYFATGDFPHDSTAEVMVETDTAANLYGYTWGDYSQNFDISDGRFVYSLAIFNDGHSFTYPGWATKNEDGKARVVAISALETQAVVRLECNSSTCKEDVITANLGACEFDSNGDLVENKDFPTTEDPKPYACVSGQVKDSEDEITIWSGDWTVSVYSSDDTGFASPLASNSTYIGNGAAYTIMVFSDSAGDVIISQTQDINTNDVNMLWIIPQNIVITMSEILISITGMEFAYTQAPASLKSVLTSFWLMTVSIGDLIVIIVAESKIMPTQTGEYYLFAFLIAVCDVVFILLSMFYYEYVKDGEFDSFEYPTQVTGVKTSPSVSSCSSSSTTGVDNEGFEKRDPDKND